MLGLLGCLSGSKGSLIAASQSTNTFQVYDRDRSNAFVLAIDPCKGTIGDVGETDGIDVTNVRTSSSTWIGRKDEHDRA
jgi:myo-inositol-hexaphosphate 3-phosphohydrolase